MNPDHLIAAVLAVVLFRAFLNDYRSAGRPAPIRVRHERRQPQTRD